MIFHVCFPVVFDIPGKRLQGRFNFAPPPSRHVRSLPLMKPFSLMVVFTCRGTPQRHKNRVFFLPVMVIRISRFPLRLRHRWIEAYVLFQHFSALACITFSTNPFFFSERFSPLQIMPRPLPIASQDSSGPQISLANSTVLTLPCLLFPPCPLNHFGLCLGVSQAGRERRSYVPRGPDIDVSTQSLIPRRLVLF